jgi:hypothetical protein
MASSWPCARVPERVQLDPLDACCFGERRELALADVVRLERVPEHVASAAQLARALREHEPVIVIRRPVGHL